MHELPPTIQTAEEEALPAELMISAQALQKAVLTNQQVYKSFSDFCSRAYVKPQWAGIASHFLVELFENREDELAELTRIPDLIIELASGCQTLTCVVAFRWAAHADTNRLAKLAEALAATHSRQATPEVIHIMLALVTSLAITRYSRAEQMLQAALGQVSEEHQESLDEAQQWLSAGQMVRRSPQEIRDLWEHRLRRRRTAWSWDSKIEHQALLELADGLLPDQPGAAFYQAIVPAIWWELAVRRAEEILAQDTAVFAAEGTHVVPAHSDAVPAAHQTQSNPVITGAVPPITSPIAAGMGRQHFGEEPDFGPVMVLNVWPFFLGGLMGALILAMVIWIGPWQLVRVKEKPPAAPVVKSQKPQF
jgi:hypothetical protein